MSVNNCIAKVDVGCLGHPGASTVSSQLLDGDSSHAWQILTTQSLAPHTQRETGTRHTDKTVEQGRGWEQKLSWR